MIAAYAPLTGLGCSSVIVIYAVVGVDGVDRGGRLELWLGKTISAAELDRYLTEQLQRKTGFEMIRLSAGYRLRAPDADGCNWSGDVIPIDRTRGPPDEAMAAAVGPIAECSPITRIAWRPAVPYPFGTGH